MTDLPSGTVTFLFTDIEGSTGLWEEQPERMRVALARHDAFLRSAIETNGGHVLKTLGDAFCAVFAVAADGLRAALAAQKALLAAQEPDAEEALPVPLQVRMALHSGEAEERDGDYFGPALNRVSRLLAIGHGGQVILSEVTQVLVRDSSLTDLDFKDLGHHRLRDLHQPERVFQLLAPELPAQFPPLRSLTFLPNNLPQQVTSFIGREREMATVRELLGKTRVLTLTGPGGTGKTRLSLQVAADLLDQYPSGVWVAELGSLSDPGLVPQAVASALGVREVPSEPLPDTLVSFLGTKRLLLVLDNCEHLLDACAGLAAALVRQCPGLQILATSREHLGIAGELTYHLGSLSIPDPRRPVGVEALAQCEAVHLFVERAAFHQPQFTLSGDNALSVARVCSRLDGIPLALELAAARVKALSIDRIAERLDDRFRLLTGGSRTALPRQQTLRALIDWSYDLLQEPERVLLRRLSAFAGGWTVEAAEAVCGDRGSAGSGQAEASGINRQPATVNLSHTHTAPEEVLDVLAHLVEKSLVQFEGGSERYFLLETMRQYAQERLLEAGENAAVRQRHLEYFRALAERAKPELRGRDQGLWLERLETEHDNLRAALEWSRHTPGGVVDGLRLAVACWEFWAIKGHLREGREVLEALMDARDEVPEALYASALRAAGLLAWNQDDNDAARAFHEQSLAIVRGLNDLPEMATSMMLLALVVRRQGDCATSRALHQESLVLYRKLGDRWGMAHSLGNLAFLAAREEDHAQSYSLHEQSLALFRELDDPGGIALALGNLATAATQLGDHAASHRFYTQSLERWRELNSVPQMVHNLRHASESAGRADYPPAARAQYQKIVVKGLAALASLVAEQHRPMLAARLAGRAQALYPGVRTFFSVPEQGQYEQAQAAVRAALNEQVYLAACAAGSALTVEQALTQAVEDTDVSPGEARG